MNISRVKTFPLLLAALAAFATARASTIHVAPGGTGAGTSWSDALGDVQAAVDAAAPGDTIQLAGGTYAVSSPVAIGKTVFICGGYDPATGLPGATPTVVTRAGDATTRLVSVSGVSGGELRDVTLSGGVLYPAADHAYGAGIQISGSTGYALVNCTVSGNKAQSVANKNACGGGVAVVNASSASLTDCSILDNEVENVGKGGNYACGAGLYVAAGCSAAVTNGVVARNNVVFGQNSQRGAGVYTEGAVSLFNCLVYNNVCRGSKNYVLGDGLCAYNGAASLALNFCTVAFNGTCGLYRQNGAVSASDSILWGNGDDVYGTVTLTRCNVADGDSTGVNGNISAEPKFVFGFRLDAASPCLDQSALTAAEAGLDGRTTLASGATDSGFADLGWHAPAAAVDASAADLHVATTGSDTTGDGSSGAPFASVTKALTLAAPGTTIHVGEGTFNAASGEVFPWVFDKALDVAIAGAGAELTVFDAGGADASIARMTNSTCIAFSGATFTGTAYGPTVLRRPAYGGAIGAFASCGAVIDSCAIRDNELRPNADSSNAFGGGAGFYASGEALVTNCVVKGNVANARHTNATYAYGGGLYFAKTEGRLVGCRVQGNRIQFAQNGRRGGGVCNEGDSNVAVELVNCLIVGNTAYTSRGVGDGDGLWGRFTIRHSTVAANPGGGKGVTVNGAVTASDSIFYANGGDFNGKPTLTYCNTQDGLQVGVNGNISVDPLFDRGYYLATGSLCIDAGSQNAADSSIAGRTTSTDGTADAAVLDMGYHYATGSQAAEYFVSTEGSDDNPGTEALPFRSVTKALSVVSDADRIHIGAGRYTAATETFPLLVNGLDAIELLGTGEVVLDGGMANNQVLIIRNSTQVKLSGLTLTGGYPLNNPSTRECLSGGLYAEIAGGLRLTDCVISNNYTKLTAGFGYGGGICIKTGSAEFIRCLIADNEIHTTQNNGYAFGGGAYLDAKATVVMRDCVVLKNRIVQTQYWKGCGLAAADTCTVVLDNCLINGNKGEGTYLGQGVGLWGKRFFLNNTTVAYNYGRGWDCNSGTACAATNSLFWGNSDDISGTPALVHCNVEDGDGAGMNGTISVDPQFDRTLYLAAGSPCRDTGFGTATALGLSTKTTSVDGSPDTGTVDMGYHYAAGLAAPAPAEIFVAASGDDATGTGGAGAPFRSITRALASAGSGTRVNVGAGVYNAASGEAFPLTMRDAMHVAIVGAGADATVLNAEGANANVFSFFDVGGLEIRGFEITGANPRSTTSGLDGGGVQICDCSGVEIADCTISGNAVYSTAGTVYGGGISLRRAIGAVRNCRITDNATTNTLNNGTSYGMGISVGKTSDVLIDRCVVAGNRDRRTNYSRGGGIFKHPFAKLTVRNSLIVGNEPLPSNGSGEGGGIHCADPSYGGEKIFIQSCTIADNAWHGIFGGAKYTTLTNTIVWGNTSALYGATAASAGNCNIQDGVFAGSGGNISSDPLFRNSAIGNYTLRTRSPCVDAGCPLPWMDETAVDVYGRPRVRGKGPDIGAAEFPWAGLMIQVR